MELQEATVPASVQEEPVKDLTTEPASVQEEPVKDLTTVPASVQEEPDKDLTTVPASVQEEPAKDLTTVPVSVQEEPAKDLTTSTPDLATNQSSNGGLGDTVAKHYNQLEDAGLQARALSRIFHMRNLNNWIKSVLISEFIQEIRSQNSRDYKINVLDLCSGKGGDLLKWKKGNISQLVCADIAGTSVEQCESRFKEMVERNAKERHPQNMFTAEFISTDCTKSRLKDLFKDPTYAIDLTSCQFSYHYSFESYDQADRMLQNACEALKPGGYFIGSTPNAYELVKRWRAADGNKFGNDVYSVTFDSDHKEDIPLFGAKYMFHLEGVVDCPEFLVHFPTFVELAKKHGMSLVYKKTFGEYVTENAKRNESRTLMGRMQALEPYPADEDVEQLSKETDAYDTAKEVHAKLHQEAVERGDHEGKLRRLKVGTLSKDEWDAVTLYVVFAFKKDSVSGDEPVEEDGGPAEEPVDEDSGSGEEPVEESSTSNKRPHEESAETTEDTTDQASEEGSAEKIRKVE